MFIVLSQTNPDPMYKQVVDQVKDAIARGDLKPGSKLPSIRELSKDLDTSPITIKRSYSDLEKDGYIMTRSGLGSFVAELDMDGLRNEKTAEIRAQLAAIIAAAAGFGINAEEIRNMIEVSKEEHGG